MLTKILFTAAVIGVVIAVYRFRSTRDIKTQRSGAPANPAGVWMAYGFVGVLVVLSLGWYILHWRAEHRVVTIRVFHDQSGTSTVYRAHRNAIQGRSFESLDGRRVTLGERDRVEMIEEAQ
ncbi:MAG: antitermination protein NusG [Gammaproteobacteria bacterium]|nr:antitermination protein NusG [Gammaproteobacteria bacterium]